MAESRYTLSLPSEIYNELKGMAEQRGVSIKEVVRQSLKFGLVAIKLEEDPNTEIIIRERLPGTGKDADFRETRLQFIW